MEHSKPNDSGRWVDNSITRESTLDLRDDASTSICRRFAVLTFIAALVIFPMYNTAAATDGPRCCVMGDTVITFESESEKKDAVMYAQMWGMHGRKPTVDLRIQAILRGLAEARLLGGIDYNQAEFTDKASQQLGELPAMRELYFSSCAIGDSSIMRLNRRRLRQLSLFGTGITDVSVVYISDCPKLRILDLGNTSVTGAGLRQISRLKNLTQLSLAWTSVVDSDLKLLRGLDKLEVLNLQETAITDNGIQAVASLKSIKRLVLLGTRVSDKAIPLLARMPKLAELSIDGTEMTEIAYKEISASIPQIVISPSLEEFRLVKVPSGADAKRTPESFRRPMITHLPTIYNAQLLRTDFKPTEPSESLGR